MRWAWKSAKDMTSNECYVEARMVVAAPGTLANAAATNTPYLGRALGLSVGWKTAVNSVVGSNVLAVKAAFGSVGLVGVEDMEAVTKEETTKA